MAKAGGTSSTPDWIWLRKALDLAFTALGSMPLAKERLRKWLATGELPWSCMSWEGLDAEGLAKLKQSKSIEMFLTPSGPYYESDPQFWSEDNNLLEVDWANSSAREYGGGLVSDGAHAQGIKVPRARLLELLPGGAPEDEKEAGPQQRRILPVLTKLFPPDGKVPDDVPTETVRGRVNDELASENKRLGLHEASWDSVNRALGRALPRR